MGQTPSYDFDIFISYSHRDNSKLPGAEHGWVDAFHDALENWLRHRRGFPGLAIWRDRKLNGNTLFDLSIENRLKSSALFIALVSGNYLGSDYCRKELRCFHRYGSGRPGGLRVGEESRILNVLLRNIAYRDWPPELAGTSGFPLHDGSNPEDPGDFTSPRSERFEKQLRAVVDAVEKTLRALTPAVATAARDDAAKVPVAVYLADVADDLAAQRKRLGADLTMKDARILSAVPPPYDAAGHESRLQEILGEARLSVHLLGRWPGRPLADREDTSFPREQLRMALAGPTPQVIWLPENLAVAEIEDEAYRGLLQDLESGVRGGKSFDFLRGTPTALTEFLRQKIRDLDVAVAPSALESVLIDTHQKDQSYAYRLADVLSHQGLDVEFNKESRDPLQSLDNFESALRQARNLVIMFGGVAPEWLLGRIRKAVKVAAEQFAADTPLLLQNIWVLLLPASGGRHPLLTLPPIIRIAMLDNSHSDDIDPAVVDRLLGARSAGVRG